MLFSLVWKEFTRRKSRALLSMVGIIFSITLLVAVISISKEVQEVARKPLESAGADMLVQKHGEPCAFSIIKLPANLNPMPAEAIEMIESYEDVSLVAGVLEFQAFEGGVPTIVTGLDPEKTEIGPIKPTTEKGACCEIIQGRYLEKDDTYAAVVSESFASDKNLTIGSKLNLADYTFTTVGIINTGRMARIAGAEVFIPLSTAQIMVDKGKIVDSIFIKLKSTGDPKKVEKSIIAYLGEDTVVTTSADMLQQVAGQSTLTQNMASGISIIVVLMVMFLVSRSALASVTERTREIGIMKAVGWTDRNVADLIVTEYILQGLIGGGVGCALGSLTSYLYLMNSNLSIQSLSSYPACASSSLPTELTLSFHVSPLLILIALGISAGIGVLAGYLASRRAARKQPAEALRST